MPENLSKNRVIEPCFVQNNVVVVGLNVERIQFCQFQHLVVLLGVIHYHHLLGLVVLKKSKI